MASGKVIGDYEIVKKLAEGGFGITYLARHVELKTNVCIKHALNISREDTEFLYEEARAIWDLRHYGIPAMRGSIKMPDGSVALVMSYIPGPTLSEIRENNYKKGIDPEHVAWIIERNLNILKYLHMNGVVHGDVKPQNMIIQPESHTVVLVDYGLAKVRPSATDGAKGYTPYFASPEQRDGKVILPESDFYSLGMTAVFALGGDVEIVKVPGHTPAPLCDFIKRLIRREVLSRPNWQKEDLCETIKKVRHDSFGRSASSMKPMKI